MLHQHWKQTNGFYWCHCYLHIMAYITQSSYIHGQTYQPVVWWITASCLLVKGRWTHLKAALGFVDVWQASETSHSKSSLDNVQHKYLPAFLVNVYSYHLMVKSVSCCCVCGSWLFSNPVTNYAGIYILDGGLSLIIVIVKENVQQPCPLLGTFLFTTMYERRGMVRIFYALF